MAEQARKPDLISRRVRARNWALFALLAGVVLLFYALTIVRMGGAGQ